MFVALGRLRKCYRKMADMPVGLVKKGEIRLRGELFSPHVERERAKTMPVRRVGQVTRSMTTA